MSTPRISLCMIAPETVDLAMLERCLESATPHVDEICISVNYKGKKPKRRRELGRLLKHYKAITAKQPWADNFAAAREHSFALASNDWRMWLDTDDVLEGGDQLRQIVAGLDTNAWPAPQAGLAMPYYYGHDDHGNCITILTRTRVVHWPTGWQWIRRVHEDLAALVPVDRARTADVAVRHWPDFDEQSPPAERNLRILQLELQDDPNDKRTHLYLAHQYMALQDWPKAAAWYERYLKGAPATMETWQAWHFLAVCWRQMEHYADSSRAEMEAISLAPDLAEPYFGLAEIALLTGEPAEALHWTNVGRQAAMAPADAPIFLNPLAVTFNPVNVAYKAWASLGNFDNALQEIERGLEVRPADEHLLQAREDLERMKGEQATARVFTDLVQKAGHKWHWVGQLAEMMGLETLRNYRNSRTLIDRNWYQRELEQVRRPQVIIFCGQSAEPFGPDAVDEGGLGGSEAAVVYVGRELAKAGAQVLVYNEPGAEVGRDEEQPGLSFWPWQWYDPAEASPDLFVAWRSPFLAGAVPPKAKQSWLWMHDLHSGGNLTPARVNKFDLVRPVSSWAGDYLRLLYPWLPAEKVEPTANGRDPQISLWEDRDPPTVPRLIWTSSPDRGLDTLLRMWRRIRLLRDDAELHVYYGWDGYDRATEAMGYPPLRLQFKAEVQELARQEGVTWHGRVGRAELATAWRRCNIWAYPTDFLEVSCITAMNAQASGCAILASRHGALAETLGPVGIQVAGPARGISQEMRFTGYLANIVQDPAEWGRAAEGGPEHIRLRTWATVAKEWMERI
jgi:glycosyltransferase involved in cell wall biosynthesis/tetratricopeptide (TPR) repeat protein